MEKQILPLTAILEEIPDNRKSKGKRHSLSAILALAISAVLCGARSYGAIADFGRNYNFRLIRTLGFTHDKTPCKATLSNVFRDLDWEFLEKRLSIWISDLVEFLCQMKPTLTNKGIAIDGKTLRGSRKQGASKTHLLSAMLHNLGVTLFQIGVDDKTNEIGAIAELLAGVVLEGRIMTMDALLTQRKIAQKIVDGNGDYLMIVKENQPNLLNEIKTVFESSLQMGNTMDQAQIIDKSQQTETPQSIVTNIENSLLVANFTETIDQAQIIDKHQSTVDHIENSLKVSDVMNQIQTIERGHGRIETRKLTVADASRINHANWPGIIQIFQIQRNVIFQKSGKTRSETVYGITSLLSDEAAPSDLLNLSRSHWHIENKSHWVRDVTFDEDRSQIRCGNGAHIMSSIRNLVITLIRLSGEKNIAAACRRFAAQPWSALVLIDTLWMLVWEN